MAVLCVGCGGGGSEPDPPPPPAIAGNWVIEQSATVAIGLNMSEAGSYTLTILRVDTDGNHAQVEKGSYVAAPADITFTPAQASCPGAHPRYREDFTSSAGSLILTDPSGTLQFVPNPYTPSGALVYGCFASDGTFTASPLAPVN